MTDLNDSDAERFRALIQDRLTAIAEENNLGKTAQATVTLDQQSVGRLSRMDALQSQAMAKAQQQRRDVETQQLNAALVRLDEGEFGFCEECGEEIGRERLQLNPALRLCISCARG